MSADDMVFLDVLSSLPNDIRKYSGHVADHLNNQVENLAGSLRDSLASSPWLPESIRTHLPPPLPKAVPVSMTTLEKVQDWVYRHKILAGLVVFATGSALYRVYGNNRHGRKTRRATRARSGARLEVVVIAGSPTLPLTRSLSLDLERKGFIVFVVCNGSEDEVIVQALSRTYIRPLGIDLADPLSAGTSIEHFARFLQAPHSAIPTAKSHQLNLRAVVLIPSLNYQTSPIATIPPSSFADLFNTHLLHPILTIQFFLPLLTTRLDACSGQKSSPKVLVFTPSIVSSVKPPFHAPEATVCSALSAFTEVLTAELRPLSIPVSHLQLGIFDFTGLTPANTSHRPTAGPGHYLLAPESADTLSWPEATRLAYARNFISQTGSAISAGRIRGIRGSSLRDLHNAVFDVIDGNNASGVVRVGLGASVYGFVGRWVPRGVVAWMMGIRKVNELAMWRPSTPEGPSSPPLRSSDSGPGSSPDCMAQKHMV